MSHKITAALALAAALLLTGCATNPASTPAAPATVTSTAGVKGSIYGGRQPISGASITLFQTGTTGYGAGATPLESTTSNSNGMFNFNAFTCTAGTQLYLASVGGDPYGNGENNVAATLMAGLVSCNNASSITFVNINEVTTISTVWALAPFMNDLTIGAPASNQNGLANAFQDVSTLVNFATGVSPGANLPPGATVPTAEINTLANALVSCINSFDNASTTPESCPT